MIRTLTRIGRNLLLLLCLVLTSCATLPALRGSGPQEMVLRVDNNAWVRCTLYLVRVGTRLRIGTINASSEKELMVPTHLVQGSRWSVLVQPTGTRGKKIFNEASADFPLYGYYRYLVPGEFVVEDAVIAELVIQEEIKSSFIMVR